VTAVLCRDSCDSKQGGVAKTGESF
jgi:hypothetical protein